MEKEILEILKSIQLDIKGLKDEVKDLKEGQKIIEKKLDGVVEQTVVGSFVMISSAHRQPSTIRIRIAAETT